MLPADLIRTASLLAKASPKRPIQSNLRRAQSTAYYAVFHTLARATAETLVGTTAAARASDAWAHAYRAIDHGRAGNQCASVANFPPALRRFAAAFIILQQKRHQADYDPSAIFKKSAVLFDIKTAETAISDFNATSIEDRRAFAVWVVVKKDRKNS